MWTEETRARLWEPFERGGYETSQMDEDIRTALAEIERLRVEAKLQHEAGLVHLTRAEAAEARVRTLEEALDAALNCDPALRPVEWAEWRERAAALREEGEP